jgi:hypothetical protein
MGTKSREAIYGASVHAFSWLRRSRSLAYFNLRVVDVLQQLVKVAHVEPFSAARALHEMISLGFGHAVRIEAALIPSFRHRSRVSFRRSQCWSFRSGLNTRST